MLNSPSVCNGDEPKSGLIQDLGDRLQFRNMTFGTSAICMEKDFYMAQSAGRWYNVCGMKARNRG